MPQYLQCKRTLTPVQENPKPLPLGLNYTGIEREDEYLELSRNRLTEAEGAALDGGSLTAVATA